MNWNTRQHGSAPAETQTPLDSVNGHSLSASGLIVDAMNTENSGEKAVGNGDLTPLHQSCVRRWLLEHHHPGLVAKIDKALEFDEPPLWFLTTLYTLTFVGIPALIAMICTVLAFVVGHPWNWITVAFWAITAICVLMVYDGYRKDKARLHKHSGWGR